MTSKFTALNALLIPLTGKVYIDPLAPPSHDPLNLEIAEFNSRLTTYGYSASLDLSHEMLSNNYDVSANLTQELIDVLAMLNGGHVEHSVLFKNFPESCVDDDGYLLDRLLHTLRQSIQY